MFEITEILSKKGIDLSCYREEDLEDLNSDFDSEMEEFIHDWIRDHEDELVMEWSSRLNNSDKIKKKTK